MERDGFSKEEFREPHFLRGNLEGEMNED